MTTIAELGLWILILGFVIGGMVVLLLMTFLLMGIIEPLIGHEVGEIGLILVLSVLLTITGAVLLVVG